MAWRFSLYTARIMPRIIPPTYITTMMAIMQRQPAGAPLFLFNLQLFYRIWFSNDPDRFLGIENELRFIRMRKQNRNKKIYFIFSASALTPNALRDLKKFCQTHQFFPVDFDTEIMPMLEHEYDKEMYLIARAELMHALRNQGGNLAAASDSLRLIVPVIEKFGIYSDFDVELHFNKQARPGIEVLAPMLFNVDVDLIENGAATAFLANSDFLAFACDRQHTEKLSEAALLHIRGLQKKIIDKYKNPFTMQSLFHRDEIAAANFSPGILHVFELFSRLSVKKSVYQFRKFIMEYDYPGALPEVKMQLQYLLILWSVTRMSGPCIFWSSYMNERPENDRFTYGSVPSNYQPYKKFIELMMHSRVAANKDITTCVLLKNTVTERKKFGKQAPEPGVLADLSWTAAGAKHKAKREGELLRVTRRMQFFVRKKREEKQSDVKKDIPKRFH